MKYPPRLGRAAPRRGLSVAPPAPSALAPSSLGLPSLMPPSVVPASLVPPSLVPFQAGPSGPPRLTPQQAALLPSGARFIGLDGLPRIRR